MNGVSGVGISFGADRIYDVLNQLDLYPKNAVERTKLLFIAFGNNELNACVKMAAQARSNGINTEIYPELTKIKKQMTYADNNKIPFVAIVGENELNEGKVMLKNMQTGEQKLLSMEEVIETIKL